MTTVKPKFKFGMKRRLTPARLERLKKIRLKYGSTAYEKFELDKRVCIMEAVNLMMHGEVATWGAGGTDHPPCVSEIITEEMISLNDDDHNDGKRQKLKTLATEIVGTCPTIWKKNQVVRLPGKKPIKTDVLVRDPNPAYELAEDLRGLICGERTYEYSGVRIEPDDIEAHKTYYELYNSEKIGDRRRAIQMLVDPSKAFTKADKKKLREAGINI